eukprot:3574873-Pyramimonas_sp.AAC.1
MADEPAGGPFPDLIVSHLGAAACALLARRRAAVLHRRAATGQEPAAHQACDAAQLHCSGRASPSWRWSAQ